jgi:hypothetical protein
MRTAVLEQSRFHIKYNRNNMAETLGSLCDKLIIIKLKQWHTEEENTLQSLKVQAQQLSTELNEYIEAAVQGIINLDKLIFPANKVYKKIDHTIEVNLENFGEIFSALAETNCALWDVQAKVYDFEKVPMHQKDQIVKQLAVLNLQRHQCIDAFDRLFIQYIKANG